MANKFVCSALLAMLFSCSSTVNLLLPASAQNGPEALLSSALLKEVEQVVPNFGVVSPILLRGGQPDLERIGTLKQAGVKTVVCLRDGQKDIDNEKAAAEKVGLKFVSIPLSVFGGVTKEKADQFLSIVRDPKSQPVFVHCRQGQDRAGTMVALYRLVEQSWSMPQAYKEMIQYGFHPMFVGLSQSLMSLKSNLKAPESAAKPEVVSGKPST